MDNQILKILLSTKVQKELDDHFSELNTIKTRAIKSKIQIHKIIPHYILSIPVGYNYNYIVDYISRELERNNLLEFDGISRHIEIALRNEHVYNEHQTERYIAESIINSSHFSESFKGICVLNLYEFNFKGFNNSINKIIRIVKDLECSTKFLFIVRQASKIQLLNNYSQIYDSMTIKTLIIDSPSIEDYLIHALSLLNSYSLDVSEDAYDEFNNLIKKISLNHSDYDAINRMINDLTYNQMLSDGNTIKKETITSYSNNLFAPSLTDIRIGFGNQK